MNKKLQEACEVIEDLINTVNWLGGDPYEVDCTQPHVQKALKFIHNLDYKTQEEKEEEEREKNEKTRLGLYVLKSDPDTIAWARSRYVARHMLHARLQKIKCLKKPGVIYGN